MLYIFRKIVLIFVLLSITMTANAAFLVKDNGTKKGYVNALDFTGAGVTVSKSGILGVVDIPGGAVGSGEANTASNQGVGGVGVFKQKTGVDLEFKNINIGSNKLSVTDDTVNNEIDLDVVEANLTLSNIGGAVTDAQVPNDITVNAVNVPITDAGSIITATEVEGALQENRTAVDLNTAKTTESTTVTSPLVKTGYDLSIPLATSLVSGYLNFEDWATFNGKQGALVDEAGLYAALSDVTDFVQPGDVNSIDSPMYVDGSIDPEHLSTVTDDGGIEFVITAVTTGVACYFEVPYACTISGVTLLANVSGSIVIDIWKDTYANYPPTVADTITASAKPTISSALKSQDLTLTGWTTTVSKGDILGFNVDSATTLTECTVSLRTDR